MLASYNYFIFHKKCIIFVFFIKLACLYMYYMLLWAYWLWIFLTHCYFNFILYPFFIVELSSWFYFFNAKSSFKLEKGVLILSGSKKYPFNNSIMFSFINLFYSCLYCFYSTHSQNVFCFYNIFINLYYLFYFKLHLKLYLNILGYL